MSDPEEDDVSEHPLATLLKNARQKPYRKFVEHHLRRGSTEQLRLASVETMELLPESVQDLTIEYIDAVSNAIGYDKHFWDHADVGTAFGYVIQTAIKVLPIENWIKNEKDSYKPENHELAFNLFQIATLTFAYSASMNRKQREFMGVSKGLFDRIRAFFKEPRKVGEFSRLIKELAEPTFSGRDQKAVLDEFTNLLLSRERIAAVLKTHGYEGDAGKAKLSELYHFLALNGAGQWIGETFVVAKVLYDPELLETILQLEESGTSGSELAFAAVEYVEGKDQE